MENKPMEDGIEELDSLTSAILDRQKKIVDVELKLISLKDQYKRDRDILRGHQARWEKQNIAARKKIAKLTKESMKVEEVQLKGDSHPDTHEGAVKNDGV